MAGGEALPPGVTGPTLVEGEELKYVQQNVSLFFNSNPTLGKGNLFLTTENVIWQDAADPTKAVSFHWRAVLMHALSRDLSTFPLPCIYCQVKADSEAFATMGLGEVEMKEGGEGGDADEEEDADETPGEVEIATHEVRYGVDDQAVLGVLFSVFSQCQSLHPEEEEEGEGNFFFDEQEVVNGAAGITMMNVTDMTAQDQEALSRWDALLTMPAPGDVDRLTAPDDARFADADEDD